MTDECPFIDTCTRQRSKVDYGLWCIRSYETCSTYDELAGIKVDDRIMTPKEWKDN